MTKQVPVYINNYNRLETVKNLLIEFERLNSVTPIHVVIVDNASTYPPLLDWYSENESSPDFTIHRRSDNGGPRGYYDALNKMQESFNSPFYCVCDPDIDISECPSDLLLHLQDGLSDRRIMKTGPGLKLSDIPKDGPIYRQILDIENRYRKANDGKWWDAEIDTTFFMARNGDPFAYGPALRMMAPYEVRHLPYYYMPGKLTDEERWYLENLPTKHKTGLYWSTLMTQTPKMFDETKSAIAT